MAIAFIMLALMVQTVGLIGARHRAEAIAGAAVADASLADVDPLVVREQVLEAVDRSIPGASRVRAIVVRTQREVAVRIRFRWLPPGPDWVPIWVGATATATRVVDP